jgi:hypothetical protein
MLLANDLLRRCEPRIEVAPLEWGNALPTASPFDVLIGSEIAVLRKQQTNLVQTICSLSHAKSIILISFDDSPPAALDESPKSMYEQEFNEKMTEAGFRRATVMTGSVQWQPVTPCEGLEGTAFKRSLVWLHDLTAAYPNRSHLLQGPRRSLASDAPLRESSPQHTPGLLEMHHISLYYRPDLLRTCSRCQQQFIDAPSANPSFSCRHHKGFYVCRRHPCEIRLNIDGLGDSLGYYSNGMEEWAAEFWDCCGNENKDAPGCAASPHVPYS